MSSINQYLINISTNIFSIVSFLSMRLTTQTNEHYSLHRIEKYLFNLTHSITKNKQF